MSDFQDLASPSFKPSYAALPSDASRDRADAARRNLMDDLVQPAPARPQMDAATHSRVRQLGDPFALNPQDDTQQGSTEDEQPLKFLSPKVAAPFFAAAMIDAGMPLQFPEDKSSSSQELGWASKSREVKRSPRPFLPLLQYLQDFITGMQGNKSRGKDRVGWVARSFRAPPDMESKFLRPAEVPMACWQQMADDTFTWCVPDKTPPEGVEGSGAGAKPQKPHKIFPWNQDRDKELRNLETLARDGLRLANASLITFAHLMNGLLDPARSLSEDAKRRSLFTLRDLEYVAAEHFARLAQRLAVLRKLNACRALNLLEPAKFMETPIGPDIFGGKWEELHAEEVKRRKERAQTAKEKQQAKRQPQSSAVQKKQTYTGQKKQTYTGQQTTTQMKQPFRRPPDNRGSGNQRRGQQQQGGGGANAPSGANRKSGPPNKKGPAGDGRRGGGGGRGFPPRRK